MPNKPYTKPEKEAKVAEYAKRLGEGKSQKVAADGLGPGPLTLNNWAASLGVELPGRAGGKRAEGQTVELSRGGLTVTVKIPARFEMTKSEMIKALTPDADLQNVFRQLLKLPLEAPKAKGGAGEAAKQEAATK